MPRLDAEDYVVIFFGLALILFLLIIAFEIILSFTLGNVYKVTEDGSQIGQIVSIDKTKAFLVGDRVDVYVKSSSENSESIEFCLGDLELFEELKLIASGEKKVELVYESYYVNSWDKCEWQITDYKVLD